jgi:antitoxin (DNA-binding transcriptional repressor) of toxin-antitoxin stability system
MDKGNKITVRDLRTKFPLIERRLLNGEELVVTKRGKTVALLVQPLKRRSPRKLDFAKRFGKPIRSAGPQTDIVGMLLEEREESL